MITRQLENGKWIANCVVGDCVVQVVGDSEDNAKSLLRAEYRKLAQREEETAKEHLERATLIKDWLCGIDTTAISPKPNDFEAWAKLHPPREVDQRPKHFCFCCSDYAEATAQCDAVEEADAVAAEVVKHNDKFYVIYKD